MSIPWLLFGRSPNLWMKSARLSPECASSILAPMDVAALKYCLAITRPDASFPLAQTEIVNRSHRILNDPLPNIWSTANRPNGSIHVVSHAAPLCYAPFTSYTFSFVHPGRPEVSRSPLIRYPLPLTLLPHPLLPPRRAVADVREESSFATFRTVSLVVSSWMYSTGDFPSMRASISPPRWRSVMASNPEAASGPSQARSDLQKLSARAMNCPLAVGW